MPDSLTPNPCAGWPPVRPPQRQSAARPSAASSPRLPPRRPAAMASAKGAALWPAGMMGGWGGSPREL